MSFSTALRDEFPQKILKFNEPMAAHTTFKTGGPADNMLLPATEAQLISGLRLARKFNAPVTVIGRGSNLLVTEGGIEGLTVKLGDNFAGVTLDEGLISAVSGTALTACANFAMENSLTGLEFASGIPGSIGGGACMNAGAYGGQMSDVIKSVKVLDPNTLETQVLLSEELDYGYRQSYMLKTGLVVLKVGMCLKMGSTEAIKQTMEELNRRRREKQPLNYPSAGSTFKRPEGYFAGALIEAAGLKGTSVGGAQVSIKHAGFIINTGSATPNDIIGLIRLVRQRVYDKSGVTLEPEVRIIGRGSNGILG